MCYYIYIYSYMHIMHNLKIEYLCLGTPLEANILNLLVFSVGVIICTPYGHLSCLSVHTLPLLDEFNCIYTQIDRAIDFDTPKNCHSLCFPSFESLCAL
jgi:hypothetical protein